MSFRQYALGGVAPGHLSGVLRSLRRRGISIASAQVRVFHAGLGIRTELDGLGVDRFGRLWVLELKNTQSTTKEHAVAYDLPCPNNPTLSNGHSNSERVRHALQAGFGHLAFSRTFNVRPSDVRALVIVNCTDGCVSHVVSTETYALPEMFASSSPPASSRHWDPEAIDLAAAARSIGFATHARVSCGGRVGIYTNKTKKLAIAVGTENTRWVRSIRTATDRCVLVPTTRSRLRVRRV